MNALTPIASNADDVARFDLRKGDIVLLGDPASTVSRRFGVLARHAGVNGPSRVQFVNVETDEIVSMTDEQIAKLMAEGHFDVFLARGAAGLPAAACSALTLTEAQKAQVGRRKAYVEILLDLRETGSNKRKYVEERAREIAVAIEDAKPLSYNTIVKYAEIYRARFAVVGDACLASPKNRGRPRPEYGAVADRDERLILYATQYGVVAAIDMPKGAGHNALHSARNWMTENGREDLAPRLPSVRTFQRRMGEMNRFLFDAIRFGANAARRKHSAYYRRKRPELPLQEVEVDHTTMDVRVFDEGRGMVWGRPDIITFRDRATGVVLGYAIGFEKPSYASFLQGLRHAIYGKDLSSGPSGLMHGWPYFGRPKRLLVDNALHFVGANIERACANLGIEKVEFRPGNPWLKGAEERLNGIIGRRVHNLPGATQSNAAERKKHAEVERDPALTLRELDCFLIKYFVDDYNVAEHEGLGPLRGLKGIPARLWREKKHLISLDFLPNPVQFIALAGDSEERAITPTGIRWDYIEYQSDALNVIRTNPNHQTGKGKLEGSRYVVARDPCDLGRVYVRNPYLPDSPPIVVESICPEYAAGLTLHQHRVHLASYSAKQLDRTDDPIALLMRARDAAQGAIEAMRKQRQKANTAALLARYLDAESRKERESLTRPATVSEALSGEHVDPTAPKRVARRERRSRDAMDSNRGNRGGDGGAPNRMDASEPNDLPKPIDPGVADVRTELARTAETPNAATGESSIEDLRKEFEGFDD